MNDTHESAHPKSAAGFFRMAWLTALYLMDRLLDWAGDKVAAIRRDIDLFLGALLTLLGLFNVHIGRFCDGNSADYLSCTRPAPFYYYSAFDITLVILGVFLIIIWFRSRTHR